jgi:hypothetical protein
MPFEPECVIDILKPMAMTWGGSSGRAGVEIGDVGFGQRRKGREGQENECNTCQVLTTASEHVEQHAHRQHHVDIISIRHQAFLSGTYPTGRTLHLAELG